MDESRARTAGAAPPASRAGLAAHGPALFALAGTLAIFVPTLIELVAEWIARPEYSHGFLMPLVAGWVAWERRERLLEALGRPSWLGALAYGACLAILLLGEMKLSWFLKPFALVGALGGWVWAFYGIRALGRSFAVLVVLLLMCPLPGRIEQALTVPLKETAALFATGLLDLSGISVSLEGNLLHLPGIDRLWVADACSGIRSLISLVSLSILALLFWNRSIWLRLTVLVSCVPIAVLVNGMRIWLTGFLSVKIGPEAAQGFFHFVEGFVLFAIAAAILLGWSLLLDAVFGGRRT